MNTFCRVTACGNTTAAPRVRTARGNQVIATLTLAVDETYSNGESFVRKTNYIDFVLYAAFAEAVRNLQKGTKLYIEGRGTTSTWKDRDTGKTRFKFEVIAEKLKRLPNPRDLTNQSSTTTNA